ncbi:MAG TPA: hypothetical protein VNJ52_01955 [Patescibacteria group bacterium]|nr:hypothetical protein [Patescibacteria group bacterium]
MFCPNCGIEYRPGFTRCNDCDVDLVDKLPSEEEPAEGEPADDSLELLWRGTQGGIFNEIALALEEAGIRHNREKLDARLTFSSSNAPLDIWVPEAEIEAARRVLNETLARIAQPVAETQTDASGEADDGGWDDDEAAAAVEDPHPEDAVAQVWSGEEEHMALFLKSCLAANGIGCYIPAAESGTFTVRVLPDEEARAKEIVRQVVEGTPPA